MYLPYAFKPRNYQLPLFTAMDRGIRRGVVVWHRRAGKEKACLNLLAKKMYERVGSYYYFFPTYNQGRKVLWEGMDKNGFKFIDHIPKELRKRVDNSTMTIEMHNGSIFKIIGTDNIDSIVGSNPVGCVFSEYSLQDPRAWDFIRPILAENMGWALFNFTPRGENHGWDLLEYAKDNPQWFVSVLTVDDTGALSPDVIEQERREMYAKNGDDSLFLQEYYCSFNAPVQGAYYGRLITDAEVDGRITENLPIYHNVPAMCCWDLGMDDATSIWIFQYIKGEFHFIGYIEATGEGLPYYARELQKFSMENKVFFGTQYVPHDFSVKEMNNGLSRRDTLRSLGFTDIETVPRINDVLQGIEAARLLLPRCFFHKTSCKRGLNALKSYSKKYDDVAKTYRRTPDHNWASHGADSFRCLAQGWKDPKVKKASPDSRINRDPYSR